MKEKLTIVKVGGKIVEEDATLNQLLSDFSAIPGYKLLVHGGGRSSFQSPAYLSICMIAAAMGGRPFGYPAGVFVHNDRFKHILMAMETEITKDGISYKNVQGTAEENKALADSYGHLCKLRDEVISMGIIPPVEKWRGLNPHLK